MNTTEIEKLIVSYKAHLKNDRLKDELYKWKSLAKFKGRPRLDAPDFSAEINSIDYSNLLYYNAISVSKQLADETTKEYKACLAGLFNEETLLIERVKAFDTELLKIYRELDDHHGHHHDERTISVLLTYHNPDKYTFYKDSYYKKYCNLIGITSRKKGKKYVHYLELVDDLIENYIKKDTELIELFQEIISSYDCYQDPYFKILAQDILYQMLDKGEEETQDSKEDQRQGTLNLFTTMEGTKNYNYLSLNTILYGPPGTGKTYSTIELAYRAIKGDSAFEQDGYDVAKQWFKEELDKTDSEDRQLDFITFHQNYSYEDFIMGIKPNINKSDGLSFNRHEGIFYKICQRALRNLKQSSEEFVNNNSSTEEVEDINTPSEQSPTVKPSFEKVFAELMRPLSSGQEVVIPMARADVSFRIYKVEGNKIFFKQRSGNSEALGLKIVEEIFNGKEYRKDAFGVYYHPLIARLKQIANKMQFKTNGSLNTETLNNRENNISNIYPKKSIQSFQKNYVIIIDEINRANISRVLGELITLIEEDKRWGNDHAMEVRLPDGHTKFTVPKNLYIIGTMNTADKSIALLDIALRRRFEFTALYPDSSKVSSKYRTFFETLNEQIIAKKGIDFTIGHSYFMSKNGEELDFVNAMNKKVIPLLNEYFYNAKTNKVVAELVKDAIAKAGLSNTIVPNDFQLLIQ